jgi:hypothetical protein
MSFGHNAIVTSRQSVEADGTFDSASVVNVWVKTAHREASRRGVIGGLRRSTAQLVKSHRR